MKLQPMKVGEQKRADELRDKLCETAAVVVFTLMGAVLVIMVVLFLRAYDAPDKGMVATARERQETTYSELARQRNAKGIAHVVSTGTTAGTTPAAQERLQDRSEKSGRGVAWCSENGVTLPCKNLSFDCKVGFNYTGTRGPVFQEGTANLRQARARMCDRMRGKGSTGRMNAYRQARAQCQWGGPGQPPGTTLEDYRYQFFKDSAEFETSLDGGKMAPPRLTWELPYNVGSFVSVSDGVRDAETGNLPAILVRPDYTNTTDQGFRFRQRVKSCSVPSVDQDGQAWSIQRVGPFYGNGGVDWHSFGWMNGVPFAGNTSSDTELFATAGYLAAVTRNGSALPYPPIHIHHAHIESPVDGPSNAGQGHRPIFQAHGDSACPSNLGGTDCLLHDVPHPYGYRVPRTGYGLRISVEVNDVRPPNSSKLEIWFEIAVRYTTAPRVPVALLSLGNGAERDPTDRWNFANVVYAPPDQPAVFWYSFAMPYDGHVLWAYAHVHETWALFMDVYRASGKELGLNQGQFVRDKPWHPFLPTAAGMTPESVRAHVREQLKASISEYKRAGATGGDLQATLRPPARIPRHIQCAPELVRCDEDTACKAMIRRNEFFSIPGPRPAAGQAVITKQLAMDWLRAHEDLFVAEGLQDDCDKNAYCATALACLEAGKHWYRRYVAPKDWRGNTTEDRVRAINSRPPLRQVPSAPDLLCETSTVMEYVDGLPYSRRPQSHCKPMSFRRGEVVTLVAGIAANTRPHYTPWLPQKGIPLHNVLRMVFTGGNTSGAEPASHYLHGATDANCMMADLWASSETQRSIEEAGGFPLC